MATSSFKGLEWDATDIDQRLAIQAAQFGIEAMGYSVFAEAVGEMAALGNADLALCVMADDILARRNATLGSTFVPSAYQVATEWVADVTAGAVTDDDRVHKVSSYFSGMTRHPA